MTTATVVVVKAHVDAAVEETEGDRGQIQPGRAAPKPERECATGGVRAARGEATGTGAGKGGAEACWGRADLHRSRGGQRKL